MNETRPSMGQSVLFLPISGVNGASSRYRVFQYLPAIAQAGLTYAVHLPPTSPSSGVRRLLTSFRERQRIIEMARDSEVIFVQKRLLPASQIDSLAARRPVLFDFDDAIFTSPNGDRSRLAQRRVENRLRQVLTAASLVIAGNRYLCDYASQFAKRVIHLPTVLDHQRYPAKILSRSNEIIIGWIGHSVNHPYLAGLAEILQKIAKRFPIRLLVVADRDLVISGVHVENRRWSETTEIQDILDMDIGIMPMPDDPWSRGKCGFKAIQYMAAGIPVVCAAVGANNEIVRNGLDGITATTTADWESAISELCASAERREWMGMNGRQRVADTYSLRVASAIFLNCLLELVKP